MSRNAEAIAQRVLNRIQPGDIVLMHDGHDLEGRHRRGIVPALPLILRGLKERGLESVTVSDLLSLPKNA
jgi:peptidoglycan/xylan/chitin deacetylase (PgdA/CDA1 family)